jgi:hypothetical protein
MVYLTVYNNNNNNNNNLDRKYWAIIGPKLSNHPEIRDPDYRGTTVLRLAGSLDNQMTFLLPQEDDERISLPELCGTADP